MKKSLFCVFSTILFLIVYVSVSGNLFAQGWDRSTICPTCYPGFNLLYTPDGGLFTGSANAIKLDSAGRLEWKTDNVYGLNSLLTSQNEYLVCGNYYATQQAFVKKLNSSGTIVWEKRYGQAGSISKSIFEESPGQYLISGHFANGVTMIRINDNGDSLWSNIPRVYTHQEGILIRKAADQNYLSLTNIMNSTDQIVQKIDRLTGDTVWTKKTFNVVWHLDSTSNGYVGSGGMLQKYDFNFNLVWMPQNPIVRNKERYVPLSSVVMPSGNIMTIGNTIGSNAIYMVKYSPNGIKIWEKAVQLLKDGSQSTKIIMMGPDHFGITFNEGRYMKTDTLGETSTIYVSGRVIFDENSNCTVDPGEKASLHQEIFFEPGHLKLYINSDGYYVVPADTGTFTISTGSPNSIWDADVCGSSTKTITLNTFHTNSDNNDFLLTPVKLCSRLNVDVAPTPLRRCFQGTIKTDYYNDGITVHNVKVKVVLPSGIIPLGASQSYTTSGDTLLFTIGDMMAGDHGSIFIYDSVSCDLELGATQCVRAIISPYDYCDEDISPDWDGSSIAVHGNCSGDSIAFTIVNNGQSMNASSAWRVFADNTLAAEGTFQLQQMESLYLKYPTKGFSLRLEADQHPNHPGNSRPRITIDNCGDNPIPESSSVAGFAALDDGDIFVEEECLVIRGAFDPNEKSVSPIGITSNNYIRSEDELQYRIDFQNTGTDTAFTVRIIDTISSYLDINTFRSGISSHLYNCRIRNVNSLSIVEWTFPNILLPDSNVNEAKSHGFVTFKINQTPGNLDGTLIKNKAGIIFDYNLPVITNTTTLTINNTVPYNYELLNSIKSASQKDLISISPNPLTTKAIINFTDQNPGNYVIRISDISGKECRRIITSGTSVEIEKGDLKQGFYFVTIGDGQSIIANDKLIIE